MKVELSHEEMVLLLVGAVRAVDPRMLEQGADGFSVNFQALDEKTALSAEERLLMKLRVAMESAGGDGTASVSLGGWEAERLASALERIESMGAWSADVLEMSRGLKKKLREPPRNAEERG